MPLALILAATLAAAPTAAPAPARSAYEVNRSLSDSDRLRELDIEVGKAYANGQIDGATAKEFRIGIARIRRQMILMGIQVGYRQRVRLRGRIDRLYARLERHRELAAQVRSGK
jgi:hypothetical protein